MKVECPNPNCNKKLEPLEITNKYKHYKCKCGTEFVIPLKNENNVPN